jgi:hypothetical protein
MTEEIRELTEAVRDSGRLAFEAVMEPADLG